MSPVGGWRRSPLPLGAALGAGGSYPWPHPGAVHLLQAHGGGVPPGERRVGLSSFFEVWRNGAAAIQEFKTSENGVLFAAGSCWEGVDFPGDMVSSLILPRLPFPVPDPLSRAEQEQFPSLEDYLQEVILPDMQVKLRQGFGRAIRSETDTCVVSLLDQRAALGGRYHQAAVEALPPCSGDR